MNAEELETCLVASMRPRQACLGILLPHEIEWIRVVGFNEAEASLPRNPSVENRGTNNEQSFNEAEASLPRNRNILAHSG